MSIIAQQRMEDYSKDSSPESVGRGGSRDLRNSHTDMKMGKACDPVTE